jgi:bifunctional non-homologous end joining protein LigD
MLLLHTDRVADSARWIYELKLDGYRSIVVKSPETTRIFGAKFPAIRAALAALAGQTVVDGEVVALDETGKPSFHALQNNGSSKAPLFYNNSGYVSGIASGPNTNPAWPIANLFHAQVNLTPANVLCVNILGDFDHQGRFGLGVLDPASTATWSASGWRP